MTKRKTYLDTWSPSAWHSGMPGGAAHTGDIVEIIVDKDTPLSQIEKQITKRGCILLEEASSEVYLLGDGTEVVQYKVMIPTAKLPMRYRILDSLYFVRSSYIPRE